MAKINKTDIYPEMPALPNDLVIGSRMDEQGKTINIPISSILNALMAMLSINLNFFTAGVTYDGSDNVFTLPSDAGSVVSVVINQTPVFDFTYDNQTKELTISPELLFQGDNVYITYSVFNTNPN